MIEAEKWLEFAAHIEADLSVWHYLCNMARAVRLSDAKLSTIMYDRLLTFAPTDALAQSPSWFDVWWTPPHLIGENTKDENSHRIIACCFLAAIAEAEDAE